MKVTVVSAVNDEEVLRSCLLRSPEAGAFDELILQRGFDSASTAYNLAVEQARNDVIVLLHQDVYLPPGWLSQLASSVEQLNVGSPHWAVLGLYGVSPNGDNRGHLYCVANRGALGSPLAGPTEVATLDEVVLVLRKSSGLRFDPNLPGFHFYGADICLTASARGFKSYVIPGFCIHNANEYGMFPKSFWRGYFFMRRKWRSQLPLKTPCVEISSSVARPLLYALWRFIWIKKARRPLARRVSDPAALYAAIVARAPDVSAGVPGMASSAI